mgnify:CR=1 FL=1
MSSGSKSYDLSTPFNSSCGPAWEGIRFSKTWNGLNQGGSPYLEDHPYSCYIEINRQSRMRWSTNGITWYTGTPASCFGYPAFPNPWKVNDDLALLGRLVSKIRGHSFNAAVAAAEGTQALDMISKRCNTLRSAVKACEKRNFIAVSRYLKYRPKRAMSKDVSRNWLEYRYGWVPLVNDIYEAGKALEHALLRQFTQSFRARLTRKASPSSAGWAGQRTVSKQIICRFSQDLSNAERLGLLNPEQVLWEKLPYSFLADWVSPIGQWLEVTGTLRSLQSPRFVFTTFRKDEVTGLGNSTNRFVVMEGPLNVVQVSVQRDVSASFRVPYPRVDDLEDIAS